MWGSVTELETENSKKQPIQKYEHVSCLRDAQIVCVLMKSISQRENRFLETKCPLT